MASKIQEWAEEQEADLAEITTTLEGIGQGIKDLDSKIAELQNSPGSVTPEDQKLLDAIQAKSKALLQKAQAIKVDATDGQAPAGSGEPSEGQPTGRTNSSSSGGPGNNGGRVANPPEE